MLKKPYRLTKRQDFENVYKSGSFFSFHGITMHVLKTGGTSSRIGFVVSKAYSKKAVDRNRAKRIMRSAMDKYMDLISPGYDIVMNYKPKVPYESSSAILPIVQALLNRHRLLK